MSEEKKQEPPTVNAIDLGAELKRYEAKDPAPQREERVADPTASAGDAPMYVPPNSVPVLQSLIAEAAALGHWALREQLRAVLASVEGERARHAEEVANRVAEMRAWGESKLTGAQHEIAHLRDQLRRVEGARDVATRVAADHFGTICQLRNQLRKVEGERDAERKHATEMEERALDLVRDLRLANVELASLRSLLPDVRALARWAIETEHMSDHVNTDQIGDVGRRILAVLDSQGGEGECLDRSDARGVAGDRCESGNECGRLGCPECQS